jgi:DNA invertase Pin-like site-specific DNA recombinase
MRLSDAVNYVRTSRASRALSSMLDSVRSIITFTHERANRIARFVRIVRDYRNNVPVQTIVDEYGCSKSTVLRYARLSGQPPRPRGFERTVRTEVIRLYRANVPVAEIARQCGVSPAYVSKTATEEGISRKKNRRRK